MNDLKQDPADDDDAKVAAAKAKVAVQAGALAKMSADDPARDVARRLLSSMETSATSLKLNQTLGLFSRDENS